MVAREHRHTDSFSSTSTSRNSTGTSPRHTPPSSPAGSVDGGASPPNVWLCAPIDDTDPPVPVWASRTIEAFTQPGDRVIVRSLGSYPSLPGEAAALVAVAARAGRHPVALLPTPATANRTRALLPAFLPATDMWAAPALATDMTDAPGGPAAETGAATAATGAANPATMATDPTGGHQQSFVVTEPGGHQPPLVATEPTVATSGHLWPHGLPWPPADVGGHRPGRGHQPPFVATSAPGVGADASATRGGGHGLTIQDLSAVVSDRRDNAPGDAPPEAGARSSQNPITHTAPTAGSAAEVGEDESRAEAGDGRDPVAEPATVPLPIPPTPASVPSSAPPASASTSAAAIGDQVRRLVINAASGTIRFGASPRSPVPARGLPTSSGGGARGGDGFMADVRVGPAAPTTPVGRVRVGVGRRRPAREAGPATAVLVLAGSVAPGARPPRRSGLSARVLAAWARPLLPGGVLAVLSPPEIGRPARAKSVPLASAAREAGLSYAEHIVLVHTASVHSGLRRPHSTRRPHAPFWPVHTDLHVFVAQGDPR